MSPKVHHCMGGVATAVDTAVLDVMTDKPIPGLFAAGEFVGGHSRRRAHRRVRGDGLSRQWA